MSNRTLDSLSNTFLFLSLFLMPLIIVPLFPNVQVSGKLAVLAVGLVLVLLFKVMKALVNRRVEFTQSYFDLPVVLLGVVYLVASIFRSPNKLEALFLPGTLSIVIGGVVIYFLITQLRNKSLVLVALFLATVVINIVFALTHLGLTADLGFLPSYLRSSFTPFDSLLSHLIFTAMALVTILVLLSQKPKVHLRGMLLALLVVVVGGLYLGVASFVSGKVSFPKQMSFYESWVVAVDSIKDNPLFGSGPGNYLSAFNRFKPLQFNKSEAWEESFRGGRNLYFTIATETGLLGVFVLVLIGLFVINALRKNPAAMLWVLTLVMLILMAFPASISLVLTLFIFLGLASQPRRDLGSENKTILWGLSLPLMVVLSLLVFFGGSALVAEAYYLQALTMDDPQTVYNRLRSSIELSPYTDRYHATFAQVNLNLAKSLTDQGELGEAQQKLLRQLVEQSVNQGKITVNLNPERSENWEVLARTYQAISKTVKEADKYAISAYKEAIRRNPYDPKLRLALGGLYYNLGQFTEAAKVFEVAVLAKPDYANAHYNLALAYREDGRLEAAAEQLKLVLELVERESDDYKLADTLLKQLEANKIDPEVGDSENLTAPVTTEKNSAAVLKLPSELQTE